MLLERIRKICKEKNMTLAQLEVAAELGKNTIFRWVPEKQKGPDTSNKVVPTIDKVRKVADALGVTVNDLLEYPREDGLTEKELRLLQLFRDLNEDGKDKALEYIQDIAPRYIKNHRVELVEEET